MDKLIAACIILVLIIVTFLLLIFLPSPKCYFSYKDVGEELMLFELEDIFKELETELSDINYNEKGIKMLYENDTLDEDFMKYPKLYELCRTVPKVKRIFLYKIQKRCKSEERKGSADFANKTLRCVLPIKIPGAKKSGMWLDGESRLYRDREWIIYDDSRISNYFNKHKRNEVHLLVIDVERPDHIPIGISIENHLNII